MIPIDNMERIEIDPDSQRKHTSSKDPAHKTCNVQNKDM